MSPSPRHVGITVLPEYFQNEGVGRVLDNIQRRAGATAIATSPRRRQQLDRPLHSHPGAGLGPVLQMFLIY